MTWKPARSSWPIIFVAVPLLVLFGPVLISDTSFAMRDAAHYYYPLFEWATHQWAAGRVPLWNPYENCGVPVVADATSSVFYPGKLLFILPLDFAFLSKLYIVLHVMVAAAAAYHLARRWDRSPPAAALAAISYAYGGSVVFQYCNVVFLVGAAWLPVALLATDRLVHQGNLRAAIVLALSLSMMILGGDPQAAFHALTAAILYVLVLVMRRGWKSNANETYSNEQATAPIDSQSSWVLSRPVLLLMVAAFLAFLLSAIQLLPSLEATGLSERAAFHRPRNIYEAASVAFDPANDAQPPGESRPQTIVRGLLFGAPPGSHHDRIYDFSVGPWRLIEFLWPNIGGRMLPTNRRWMSLIPAEGRVWSPTLYMGLLPVLLALAAFFSRDQPRLRWLRWITVLFTLGSFGYYGVGWLLQELHLLAPASGEDTISPAAGGLYWLAVTLLPTYVYFRYPAKLLVVAALATSQLAAFGFDDAFSGRRSRLAQVLLGLAILSTVLAFLLWLFGGLLIDHLRAPDSTLGPFDGRGSRSDTIFALLHTAIVAWAGAWLLSRAWKNPHHSFRFQLAAVLLTAMELAVANGWLIFTGPADIWRKDSPVALEIRDRERGSQAAQALVRVYRGSLFSWRPPRFALGGSKNRLAELAEWEHDTLFPKHHLQSGISLVESYGSIKLIDHESVLFVAKQYGTRQSDKTILPKGQILRLLGARWLVLPKTRLSENPPRNPWPESASLSRLDPEFPRAWIVHDVVVMPPLSRPRCMFAVDKRTTEVLFPGGKLRDSLVTAVVETSSPPAEWATQNRGQRIARSASTSHITHYDPQHVVIEAELTQPGLVVLSDTWFPGWRAFVSSKGAIEEASIYRVNRVQRGVWLPAGQYVIEYYYEPRSFYYGAAISAVSWLLLVLAAVFTFLRPAAGQPAVNLIGTQPPHG